MTDQEPETSNTDWKEFKARFRAKYPRLASVMASFRRNPMSGNTLRMLLSQSGSDETPDAVVSLPPPVMWQRSAPIVISHYGSYASEQLPTYWNATVPDIKERYGNIVRYEHHDIPAPQTGSTEYKLATVGRAIQHHAGDEAFWMWFNHIMIEGVTSVDEAYGLLEDIGIEDVEKETLVTAVNNDLYERVLWNDIDSLMGKVNQAAFEEYQAQFEDGTPVFAVFVNGVHVQPVYDSIVGVIEDMRVGSD